MTDGCFREMGGFLEMDGWVSIEESDGRLYGDSWMARLLVRLAATALHTYLCSSSDKYLKPHNGYTRIQSCSKKIISNDFIPRLLYHVCLSVYILL